ncbi:MAG: YaaL family protein [Sporolactobacillus sp.]
MNEWGRTAVFGSKKGELRREITDSMMGALYRTKDDWLTKKKVIESSIDPSDEVLYQLKLSEARYLFFLKEVRKLKNYQH